MIKDLILKNRSYRKFSKLNINDQTLKEFIDLARNSSSAGNLQPLKYIFSCKDEKNNLIFPHLAWAGYLKDWNGPLEEERPSAYIIILGDTRIGKSFGYDCGIAAQSILLGAVERGLGGCMIASIDKEGLRSGFFTAMGEPHAITFEAGYLWVADGITGTVTQRDTEGAVLVTFPVGKSLSVMISDGTSLWVADRASATVARIDP